MGRAAAHDRPCGHGRAAAPRTVRQDDRGQELPERHADAAPDRVRTVRHAAARRARPGAGFHAPAGLVRAEVAVLQPPAFSRTAHTFSHIFAGGYAAGYYSYKWAEVLSADAYAAFEETAAPDGTPSAETGRRYRQAILEAGGSRPPWNRSRPSAAANPAWMRSCATREWPENTAVATAFGDRLMNLMRPTPTLMMALLCAAGACSMAMAQSIHRIVGPDGKVTFSDRAPGKVQRTASSRPALHCRGAAAGTASPALRTAPGRLPVSRHALHRPGLRTLRQCPQPAGLARRAVQRTHRRVQRRCECAAAAQWRHHPALWAPSANNSCAASRTRNGPSTSIWPAIPRVEAAPSYRRPAATPLTPQADRTGLSACRDRRKRTRPYAAPDPATTGAGHPTPANPAGIRF